MALCLLIPDMTETVHNLKLAAMHAVCHVIDQAIDLESALDGVLQILSEQFAMQRATVTLYDPVTGHLSTTASHGLTEQEKRHGKYRLDKDVTERIFRSGEPFYVPGVATEPLFLNQADEDRVRRGGISFIGVPILLHGEPIGVLNVDRLFAGKVDFVEDVDFLKVVATLIGQFLSLHEKILAREAALKRENTSLKHQISKAANGPSLVGQSSSMVEVRRQVERVAPSMATVLLTGEPGVGKTLAARIIHELSERAEKPFIRINCASMPADQLESELFGHKESTFTEAKAARPGRFEQADTGTIFLNEIGELSPNLQGKLLRVLQDKELERPGKSHPRTIDVRILASTTRDLGDLVERGKFRLDLYYRLNVFPIRIPPLRARREDIAKLLNHFLHRMAEEYSRKVHLAPTALDALLRYDWPGNVREMHNLLERLVIMTDSEHITLEFLKSYLAPGQCPAVEATLPARENAPRHTSLKEFERNEIMAALERSGWIQYKAAEALGLSARQMGYRVKKFGLEAMIAEGRATLRNRKNMHG